MKQSVIQLLGVFALVAATQAHAYKLATESSAEERRLNSIESGYGTALERAMARWSVNVFTEPVHEEITNRMFGCDGDGTVCAGSGAISAPAAVLAGVRWNDDPPFRLSRGQAASTRCKTRETIRFETQPWCWAALFQDANRGAAAGQEYGPGHAMLYRSHFGDLQFLHAMATKDGERAAETKSRLMNWFEFAWRTADGEYTLDTRLKDIPNSTIQSAFGRTEWRVQDLYTQGAGNGLRREIKDVAFGSLLHAVQDSFAMGHANREEASGTGRCSAGSISVKAPGAILSFHAYNFQDHGQHADADSRSAFMRHLQQDGDVVEVGRALVDARQAGLEWSVVQPFFDCVFALHQPDAPAGPGDFAK